MARNWALWLGCGLMVAVGALWLYANGYSNVLAYGFLLLCPLMHLFMHKNHGGHEHGHTAGSGNGDAEAQKSGNTPSCH